MEEHSSLQVQLLPGLWTLQNGAELQASCVVAKASSGLGVGHNLGQSGDAADPLDVVETGSVQVSCSFQDRKDC